MNNIIHSSLRANSVYFYNGYLTVKEFNLKNGDSYGNSISLNIDDNPLFINDKSDFRVEKGSPAIDAGADTKSTEDYNGNPIPYNSTNPDIGIFEYIISGVTPTK